MADLTVLATNLDALNKATDAYNLDRLQKAIDGLAMEYQPDTDSIVATAKAATGWLPSAARKSLELAVLAAAAFGVAVVVFLALRAASLIG